MQPKESVTIVLVEDNDVDVMGVQRAFKQSGFANSIVVAADGIEALAKLRDGSIGKPYLILLDLNMPRMNGIEFLQEVRKDPQLKKSIVFVLTTSSAPDDQSKAHEQNVAGYIVKGKEVGSFVNVASHLDRYMHLCEMP